MVGVPKYMPLLLLLISASVLAEEEPINNGTDPTRLATNFAVQYKHTDVGSPGSFGLFEIVYTKPFGPKRMSLGITLPYTSSPLEGEFGLGDVKMQFTHVVALNKSRGMAYTAELAFDTAERPDLGAGQAVLKLSGYYAKFLSSGAIFAPALVQQFNVTNADGRAGVSNTTLDLYYVPKLANPKFFMTYDPAVTSDWKRDAVFGSLTVTFGRSLGTVWGGNSQVFIKPQVLVGGERPADWSFQLGWKVIGF